MKIEWLDTDRRRAKVTRGLLWWKRVTIVIRERITARWRHELSGDECERWIERALDEELLAAETRQRAESNWQRPSRLPKAKVQR